MKTHQFRSGMRQASRLLAMMALVAGLAPISVALATQGDIPIVFVPGTSGSILKSSDGSVLWIDSTSLSRDMVSKASLNEAGGDDDREKLTVAGVVDAVQFVPPPSVMAEIKRLGLTTLTQKFTTLPVYAGFSAWGKDTFGKDNWSNAPYDWRKGAGAIASSQIDDVVEAALKKSGSKKVILVAHSLGGLVCRDYIANVGKGKVDAIISLGTPWLGAPKTARGLTWGYNFGVGFIAPPGRIFNNLYWYVKDPKNAGQLLRVDPPLRLSFLENQATASLARNFPCVYQQLPGADFMSIYGKSIIFGTTPDEAGALLREKNQGLFDAALAWRKANLKEDNFGVAHTIIAGICDPAGDPGGFQEMQIALPGPDSLTARGGGKYDSVNDLIIRQRQRAFEEIKARGVPLFLDQFVATDWDVLFGDGTSPLLSATAGAQLRAGSKLDSTKAEKFLGPGVQVVTLMLDRPYSHGSMTDDPSVRQEVLRAISARKAATGLGTDTRADLVSLMTLELNTKAGKSYSTQPFIVTMNLGKTPFGTNGFFQNGQATSDPLEPGKTSRFYYHEPKIVDSASGILRRMTRSDLPGLTLSLTKAGFGSWSCSGVRLLIDGRPVIEESGEFSLPNQGSGHSVVIPPVGTLPPSI